MKPVNFLLENEYKNDLKPNSLLYMLNTEL